MLLFDKEKTQQAKHTLVRLLRIIMYKKGITLDDYTKCHNRYSKTYHVPTKESQSDKSNHFKTLNKVTGITFQKLHHILVSIFRFDIVRFSITLRDLETGEISVYHSDDEI